MLFCRYNLAYTPITKWISLFFTAVTIVGIIFFWGIPIGFLCQFANLYTLAKVHDLPPPSYLDGKTSSDPLFFASWHHSPL